MKIRSPQWFKFANYFMMAVFFFGAVLQFNDPDSLQWILMYGIAAVACLLWARNSISRYWHFLISAIGIVWILVLIFSVDHLSFGGMFDSFKMTNQNVEVAREIGGLLIISIWMIVLGFKSLPGSD